ncbi:helix-turn-helix domain-containing protein [Natrialba sp. INN-245]|uniref:winged helix-turn-helix domain-containing protein n=1 Tax=Natrialba sp. INN-245 TaxID=2690967 RepID=UPI00131313D8|nr:helix-turn-helix domain-containing protein [Natrialba sp. INN-245]MWV40807.1 ArsR family transcriptional regulator [Natrialba sp. INN-245]
MTAGADDESTTLSPDDAFAVLANETRFEIVRALWELYEPEDPANVVKFSNLYDADIGITFSELYEQVGYEDSGNFNYHLEQLTDHFVRRTESGYELTEAGFEVARSVVAGTVRERPRFDTVEIDERCPQCGAPVVVDYENHHVTASCSQCTGIWQDADGDDGVLFTFPFPPTGLSDRTPEEAFHAVLGYNLQRIRSFVDGVCPDCSGEVDESFDVCATHEPDDGGGCQHCHRQHRTEVAERCNRCKSVVRGPLTIAILTHPAVTAFYYDHGVDHRFASWETFRLAGAVEEAVLETDPVRIRVTVPCEGESLELAVDEERSVVDAVVEPFTGRN